MPNDRSLVKKHLDALLVEAASARIPKDVVGRLLLEETVALWLEERPAPDVARELTFTAEHLGDDDDFTFMRP